jgi:hypothetical protein
MAFLIHFRMQQKMETSNSLNYQQTCDKRLADKTKNNHLNRNRVKAIVKWLKADSPTAFRDYVEENVNSTVNWYWKMLRPKLRRLDSSYVRFYEREEVRQSQG